MTFSPYLATCVLLLAAACTTPNPNYRRPVDASLPDGAVDAPPPCESSANCAAPAGVCDLSGGIGSGKCVQCTTANPAACTGNTPRCGADNVCRGCTAHNECASGVCLPSGACSAESSVNEVAYVAPTGSGSACTKASPCASITTALGTRRPYIKVTGTIQENVEVNGDTTTILADPGAKLVPKNNGVLLEVRGASNLAIYDLEIGGSTGSGISMSDGNTATLSLHRVKIRKNNGPGINASSGTLNISQSILAENDGGGINMNSATTFDIRNNFIVRNGTDSSLVGGVNAVPAAGSVFEFNTVVDNKASPLNADTSGVQCLGSMAAPSNLVFRNIRGALTEPQTKGACDFTGSFRGEPPAGAGFRKSDPNDYHLTVNTAADIRDKISNCNGNVKDIDGDARPLNGGCDYGADELQP